MINSNAEVDGAILDEELKKYFGDNVTGNATDGWIVISGDKEYKVLPTGKAVPIAEVSDLVDS